MFYYVCITDYQTPLATLDPFAALDHCHRRLRRAFNARLLLIFTLLSRTRPRHIGDADRPARRRRGEPLYVAQALSLCAFALLAARRRIPDRAPPPVAAFFGLRLVLSLPKGGPRRFALRCCLSVFLQRP